MPVFASIDVARKDLCFTFLLIFIGKLVEEFDLYAPLMGQLEIVVL